MSEHAWTRPNERAPLSIRRLQGSRSWQQSAQAAWVARWDVPAWAALMAWVSFSLPGREGPASANGLDIIAVAKLMIRVAALGWFGLLIYWRAYVLNAGVTRRLISVPLLPYFIYVLWAGLSTAWSPLKVVTVGQWLGLVALLLMAQVIAYRVQDKGRVITWPAVLESTAWILAGYSTFVLIIHLLAPGMSGLNRSISLEGHNGMFHPTAVGAAASLGLVWSMSSFARYGSAVRWWFWLIVLLHLSTLYLSNSRAALAMAATCTLIYFILFCTLHVRSFVFLLLGSFCLIMVVLDPGFLVAEKSLGGVAQYLSRGQTIDQVRAVSGREEMWSAVWEEYLTSPVLGHGYFVTSGDGSIYVWGSFANHDAHNIILQTLASTGLIGGCLFIWAIWRSGQALWLQFGSDIEACPVNRDVRRLLLLLAVWFAGWTQGCTSFFGPVRPESVVFFVAMGVLAGLSTLSASPTFLEPNERGTVA